MNAIEDQAIINTLTMEELRKLLSNGQRPPDSLYEGMPECDIDAKTGLRIQKPRNCRNGTRDTTFDA